MMHCQCCEKPVGIHLTRMSRDNVAEEEHYCEACAPRSFLQAVPGEGRQAQNRSESRREVRVEIDLLVISEISDHQTIVFREVEGPGRLLFISGIFEITAIDRRLKGLPTPRPLTHDVWLETIVALGGKPRSVCVHDLREHTYFAKVRIDTPKGLIEIDARPSDALALSLIAEIPFFFSEGIWAACSVSETKSA